GAIQTGLVHIFQKRLGRSGELQNAVEVGLMLSHQLQRGRTQQQFERLNMDVAVSDQSLPGTAVPGFLFRRFAARASLWTDGKRGSEGFPRRSRFPARSSPYAARPFAILWQGEGSPSNARPLGFLCTRCLVSS